MSKKRVLLLIESSRGHGRGMLEGVSQYLAETDDWHVFFEDHAVLGRLPKTLGRWEGDGMIVRSHNPKACAFLRGLGKPYVELLGDGKQYLPDVSVDEQLVGRLAADHLHERGLRHFAFFSADREWWSIAREQSFRAALRESHTATCTSLLLPARRFLSYPPNVVSTDWAVVMRAARSFHPGGVNAAKADGSVFFVSDTIDIAVWLGTFTPRGKETTSAN